MRIFGKFQNEQENKTLALKTAWYINGVLSILLFLVIFFAIKIYKDRTVVVTVPSVSAGKTTFVLGINTASRNTYSVFAQYFAQLIGNFNYSNIDRVSKKLSRFYDSKIQYERYAYLLNLSNFVKNNYITQSFKQQKVTIKEQKDGSVVAYVYGLISREIGADKEIKDFPYVYNISMRVINGNIYIIAPITAKFKPKTIDERNILKNFRMKNKYFN